MKSGVASLDRLLNAEPTPYANPEPTIPRALQNCTNCDSLYRDPSGALQCHLNPPLSVFTGRFIVPQGSLMIAHSETQGSVKGVPEMIATIPPAFPNYRCRQWLQMQPDHPDLQPQLPQATHFPSDKAQ